jgi:hypothetical protein
MSFDLNLGPGFDPGMILCRYEHSIFRSVKHQTLAVIEINAEALLVEVAQYSFKVNHGRFYCIGRSGGVVGPRATPSALRENG